jgi:hypothetical protein
MDIIAPPSRDPLGRFPKGQSGNPQGRPSMPPEVKEALEAGSQRAAQRLVELIEDPDPRVAAMASTAVLDRLFGRPSQAIDAHVKQEQVDVGKAHLQILMELQQRRADRLAEEAAADRRAALMSPEG